MNRREQYEALSQDIEEAKTKQAEIYASDYDEASANNEKLKSAENMIKMDKDKNEQFVSKENEEVLYQSLNQEEILKDNEKNIDNKLAHIKHLINRGKISIEQINNLIVSDKKPTEIRFNDADNYFGYGSFIKTGGEIVALKGKDKALYKGMKVNIISDFIKSKFKNDEDVYVIGFNDPFDKNNTAYIKVAGGGESFSVKPSEIEEAI